MKSVIQMLSLSMLKSYINEADQYTGWQDKVVKQMMVSMEANNMWIMHTLVFFRIIYLKFKKVRM